MNAACLLLSFVLMSDSGQPVQHPVSVTLGPKAYRDGDVVQIMHVTATSSRLELGDTVTVKGRVRLDSRDMAQLSLYLTQTVGDGSEETDATQTTTVERGLAPFELSITVKHQGALHLTLYDVATGRPFGGVYFGTAAQMGEIEEWDVSYYLDD